MAGNKPWNMQNYLPGGMGGSAGIYNPSENKQKRRIWDLPEMPSFEDTTSYSNEQLMDLRDSMRQNSAFRNQGGFSGMYPNFYAQSPPPPESGGLWGGLKKYAGQQGISDWLDAGKTIYDIYKNETVTEPMLREQQRRAAEVWGVQKPMLEFNLASAKENRLLKKQNEVRLWNKLSRQDDEPERTIENWTPTTYA